jgi:hypothetical protein
VSPPLIAAGRLLVEGRLTVLRIQGREIRAICRGDSGQVHRLGYAAGAWHCSRQAFTGCAHLVALELVCVVPVGQWIPAHDALVSFAEVGS